MILLKTIGLLLLMLDMVLSNLEISLVIMTLQTLIENPNLESPLNEEAGVLMRDKPKEYFKKTKELTGKYAK